MGDTAPSQLTRIVSLVAALTRSDRQGGEPATLDSLGKHFGVSAGDIARDIRTLTLLGDHADADWLLSLNVWQQDGRVSVSSAGPFRRPLKLTEPELLAVRVALLMDPEGPALLAKLQALGNASPLPVARGETPGGDWTALLADAIAESRLVELLYAGEGEREGRRWMLEPHQLVSWKNRTYLLAWAEAVSGWRTFRVDRIIDALPVAMTFDRRADFQPVTDPAALFQAASSAWDAVRVRYAPAVAAAIRERYAPCEDLPDGSVAVTFRASSPAWLVRRVLEHADHAEVMEPAVYREAVRSAVA